VIHNKQYRLQYVLKADTKITFQVQSLKDKHESA